MKHSIPPIEDEKLANPPSWLARLFLVEWLLAAAISGSSLWLLYKIWSI